MRRVLVTDPEGSGWVVRVVWAPRWRALARRFGGWRQKRSGRSGDVLDVAAQTGDVASSIPGRGGGGGFDLGDVLGVIALLLFVFIAAGAMFWWVLLPLLLIVIDLVVVLVLLVVAVAGRVLFRRPWTVEATSGGERFSVPVVGWWAALRRREELADQLRRSGPARADPTYKVDSPQPRPTPTVATRDPTVTTPTTCPEYTSLGSRDALTTTRSVG